jgi:hypothetical protein
MQILIYYYLWSNSVYTQFYNAATDLILIIGCIYFKFVNAELRF